VKTASTLLSPNGIFSAVPVQYGHAGNARAENLAHARVRFHREQFLDVSHECPTEMAGTRAQFDGAADFVISQPVGGGQWCAGAKSFVFRGGAAEGTGAVGFPQSHGRGPGRQVPDNAASGGCCVTLADRCRRSVCRQRLSPAGLSLLSTPNGDGTLPPGRK
jgi:hypothetical protein